MNNFLNKMTKPCGVYWIFHGGLEIRSGFWYIGWLIGGDKLNADDLKKFKLYFKCSCVRDMKMI